MGCAFSWWRELNRRKRLLMRLVDYVPSASLAPLGDCFRLWAREAALAVKRRHAVSMGGRGDADLARTCWGAWRCGVVVAKRTLLLGLRQLRARLG